MIRGRQDPYSYRDRRIAVPERRPFWLPASNYYVFATAVSIAFFFVVWGILHDEGEDTPWITAGVGASIMLGGAVILRELILRRALHRLEAVSAQRHSSVLSSARRHHGRHKLTLEQNAAFINEIKQKSHAAK